MKSIFLSNHKSHYRISLIIEYRFMWIFSCFRYQIFFIFKKVTNMWQQEKFSQHLAEKNKDSQGFEELMGRNKTIKCNCNVLKA